MLLDWQISGTEFRSWQRGPHITHHRAQGEGWAPREDGTVCCCCGYWHAAPAFASCPNPADPGSAKCLEHATRRSKGNGGPNKRFRAICDAHSTAGRSCGNEWSSCKKEKGCDHRRGILQTAKAARLQETHAPSETRPVSSAMPFV